MENSAYSSSVNSFWPLASAKPVVLKELKEVVKDNFFDGRRWIFSRHPEVEGIENYDERADAFLLLRQKWDAELQVLRELETEKALKLLVKDDPDINHDAVRDAPQQIRERVETEFKSEWYPGQDSNL